MRVELVKQSAWFFFQKGLVGASNYDKKDCTIEGAKERFEQTKKKRDWSAKRRTKNPKIWSTAYK